MSILTNRRLVEKSTGDATLTTAATGLMNDAQSRVFVRKLIDQPTLLSTGRTVIMGAPKQDINKVNFAARILAPGTATTRTPDTIQEGGSADNLPARFLPAADRSRPDHSKVTLDAQEVLAEVRLPDEVLEDNIEGQSFQDTVMELIAERAALDLEELAIQGDDGLDDTDPYLDLLDGYLLQATSNPVNAASASISKTIFRNAIKNMPTAFLRLRPSMRYWISHDQDANLRHQLADRATTGGDSFLLSDQAFRMFGVPVDSVALMPDAQALFGPTQNHLFGIWRRIRVETAREIRSREWIVVLTARVDFKLEEVDAEVKVTSIGT